MAKGLYKGVSGIARKATKMYKEVNLISRNVKCGYRGVEGVSRLFFNSNRLDLILDGKYQTNFTITPVRSVYDASGCTIIEGDGYIEVQEKGYKMGALITENAIDLSLYNKMNIEADVCLYSIHGSNRVEIGAMLSNEVEVYNGHNLSADERNGPLCYKNIYYGLTGGSTFKSVSFSLDISDVTETGYVYLFGTSVYYSSDYTYIRIKNWWLSKE